MAHLSEELRTALDSFNKQVSASERFLSKQPGASEASALLASNDIFGANSRLVFGQEQDDNGYQLRILDKNEEGEQVIFLGNLPIAKRVEACKSIPELIESAKSASQELQATEISEVAAQIKSALVEHSA